MDKDILKDAFEAFEACEEAEAHNREAWLDDIRFAKLGEQWPSDVKSKRQSQGRPCLTVNRMPTFIRQVVNDARLNKPSISVVPTDDDATDEAAEIYTGLIRQIQYASSADVAYDTAFDHAVTGGFGYFRIATDYASADAFDQDIVIERVQNPLNVYGDPESIAADSSDWNTAFVIENYKADVFRAKYKNASLVPFDGSSSSHDWMSEEHVRVAEYWTRSLVSKELVKLTDGSVMYADEYIKMRDVFDAIGVTVEGTRQTKCHKVKQRIITGAEVLEETDWAGIYIPIVPVYGEEVCIEGKRYFVSLIRHAKDSQQMHNYWRTVSTELVALAPKAPFVGPKGAFNTDSDKWASANSEAHAYIEYDGGVAPTRQPFAGVPAGALQEALNSSEDMKAIIGIYDASLGARSNETSGKAILARQKEGDVSTYAFIDNLNRAITHAGRILVDLIPRVYNLPRIVRVMHEDGTNESIRINEEHRAEPPNMDSGGMTQSGQIMGEREQKEQQEFLQGVTKMYDLTVGKYDVVCKPGPSYSTQREQAADQMMQFLQSFPGAAPIIGDLVAKNLDWPGASDIADRLKAMLPPQVQGQNPVVMQMQQQMQQITQQAGQQIAELQSQLAQAQGDQSAKMMDAQIKAQEAELKKAEIYQQEQELKMQAALKEQELQIKQFEAETKRIDVTMKAQEVASSSEQMGLNGAMEAIGPVLADIVGKMDDMAQTHGAIIERMEAPRTIIRDEQGRPVGVQIGSVTKTILRGQNGQIEGV